jgi:parallel beta-helix repeat protein
MIGLLAALISTLAGCGGGGGDAQASTAPPASAAPPAPAADPPAPTPPPTTEGGGTRADAPPSNSATVGTARALSAAASLAVAGVPDTPPPAAASASAAAGGHTYYVDSHTGSDTNDGRSASAGNAGTGPWQSLARVMQSTLGPGDALILACGSEWHETLRVPASGTATRPVVVSSPGTGCTTPPAIDGSVAIAPQAWAQHRGSIYKATLAATPLQLLASSGVMTAAHHPNRGHLASDPTSPYLALAADGNTLVVSGRTVSNALTTGSDLVLPEGASIGTGARIRLRTNSWVMDEAAISAASGNTLTLATPTTYPATAGWGYFLLGQLWMLDSAGEWHHDAASGQLYAWMPDGAAPAAALRATVLTVGIDLQARDNVIVNGLVVRRVGTGINLRQTQGVQLRNSKIEDTAGKGADAALSTRATFESNSIARTGSDAISGQDDNTAPSTGMTVRNNLVRDSGVLMLGDQVLSLPQRSRAAIRPGSAAVVAGNAVINAGYIGIWPTNTSLVENNFVFGACTVLDDCGGIYTGNASNNSRIRGNTVVHIRGTPQGKPADARHTQAQGIYLDESASGVQVEDNTVIDADNGIHVHVSNNNLIRGNRLYGNRASQIWLQETRNRDNPNGDVFGNLVHDNQIAPALPGAVGLRLQTRYASTAAFGSFAGNRYYDRASAAVAYVSTATGQRDYTLPQWQRASGVGSALALDATGSGVSATPYAAFAISGANLVGNSALQRDSSGWGHWNETAPSGQLVREACPAGTCLRYSAGGSPGLVTSPNFSVQQGQWYRLSVDIATEQDNQAVQLLVRRGGGGGNGYESLSHKALGLTAGRTWGRYSAVFQATKTVNARDAATGDLGARVDIQGIEVGGSVRLANVEVVPLAPSALAHVSGALINVGGTAVNANCPLAATHPAMCTSFSLLADATPVAWPLALPAYSATLLYAQEASLLDADRDGIADAQDTCPGTAAGATVNAAGCALVLR